MVSHECLNVDSSKLLLALGAMTAVNTPQSDFIDAVLSVIAERDKGALGASLANEVLWELYTRLSGSKPIQNTYQIAIAKVPS